MQIAEETLLPPPEGQQGHWPSNANVDAHVAGISRIAVAARRLTAGGEDAGQVNVPAAVGQVDRLVDVDQAKHRSKQLGARLLAPWRRALKDGRPDKAPAFVLADARRTTIDHDHYFAWIRVGDWVEIDHFLVVAVLLAGRNLPRAHKLAGEPSSTGRSSASRRLPYEMIATQGEEMPVCQASLANNCFWRRGLRISPARRRRNSRRGSDRSCP